MVGGGRGGAKRRARGLSCGAQRSGGGVQCCCRSGPAAAEAAARSHPKVAREHKRRPVASGILKVPTEMGAEDLVELLGEVRGAGCADLAEAGGITQDVEPIIPAQAGGWAGQAAGGLCLNCSIFESLLNV